VGRIMIEVMRLGIHDRMRLAGDVHQKYLYDGCIKYKQPHWKRIANAMEFGADDKLMEFLAGKENDGHASLMLFTYNLYANGVVGAEWLGEHKQQLGDAAGWFFWQIEKPEESNFNKVLYSESEASTQKYGGYDLFSNAMAYYGLRAYGILFDAVGDIKNGVKCRRYADVLRKGIMEKFISIHPRYGLIFTDTIDDAWTWEYKRFAPLFVMADLFAYDAFLCDGEWYEICANTYKSQKEDYFSYASGRQMGYGQGYIAETAILLDEYEDMAGYMNMAAFFSYHHTDRNWIVPEGVIMHPSGRFWFRNSDLGNGVQQGEIVKCGRLIIGLDDNLREEGLRIIPRLPMGWNKMTVSDYRVYGITSDGRKTVSVSLTYEKIESGWKLVFSSANAVKTDYIRIGPFSAGTKNVMLTGADQCTIKILSNHAYAYVGIGRYIENIELVLQA